MLFINKVLLTVQEYIYHNKVIVMTFFHHYPASVYQRTLSYSLSHYFNSDSLGSILMELQNKYYQLLMWLFELFYFQCEEVLRQPLLLYILGAIPFSHF